VSGRAPRRLWALSYVVLCSGIALLAVSWWNLPIAHSMPVLALALAAVVAEVAAAVALPRGGSTSLGFPLSIAAAVMSGPAAAGVVAACSAAGIQDVRSNKPLHQILFNVGQLTVSAVVSGHVYLLLGGRVFFEKGVEPSRLTAADFPTILVPILALGITAFLVNSTLLSIVLSMDRSVSPWKAWRSGLAWVFPMQIGLTFLGVSIAQVMSIEPLGLLLFFFPLVVSRQVYLRYVDLKAAYLDTVRSLVGALESKDPYTSGHSERVAKLAEAVARSMGFSEEELEHVRLAAQLHDLGKMAIANTVLMKPGRLTSEEIGAIRLHPGVGAGIVERVPSMRGLAPIVRHHHERFDGDGYGSGLARDEIPIAARILAVADSFDAMTTERAYRDAMSLQEAIEEVLACSGTQFDPEVVEHFVRVVETVEVSRE